jgi:hypothetical protein
MVTAADASCLSGTPSCEGEVASVETQPTVAAGSGGHVTETVTAATADTADTSRPTSTASTGAYDGFGAYNGSGAYDGYGAYNGSGAFAASRTTAVVPASTSNAVCLLPEAYYALMAATTEMKMPELRREMWRCILI